MQAQGSGSAAEACGKVLVCGGYAILEQANAGLVFPVSARFHATVSAQPTSSGLFTVYVLTPQVQPAEATYTFCGGLEPLACSGPRSNAFVEHCLLFALTALQHMGCALGCDASVRLQLRGDDTFYCEGGGKTGLGSSAALVSSMCAALFRHFGQAVDAVCHRVAQVAHCAAQGKVGSGFDVSAAFHGAHVYSRFSPAVMDGLVGGGKEDGVECPQLQLTPEQFMSRLRDQHAWSYRVRRARLPQSMRLLLGDVRGGSNSPGMVRRVLAWKRTHEETHGAPPALWKDLARHNHTVQRLLCDEECQPPFAELKSAFGHVRGCLKQMGQQAGVEVEPDSQTAMLDALMQQPDVVLAGVPGAGGHDAVFALVWGESGEQQANDIFAAHNVQRIAVHLVPDGLMRH